MALYRGLYLRSHTLDLTKITMVVLHLVSVSCGDPRPETKQTQDALTILQRKLMFGQHAHSKAPPFFVLRFDPH